jgi:tetratricopeptide (TPR) repeat protein
MVLADAASKTSSSCIVVSGAGTDDANGVYAPTGKKWHDADVYENDAKCLLSREPHKNSKSGETSYGWIIGQDRKPLYAVQSPATTPPTSGWRKFSGSAPLPQFEGPCSYAEAATTAAESFKDSGKAFFVANKYSEAEARWTRALSLAGDKDVALKVALYSNRSEARLRLSKFDAALCDAQEALKLKPIHDKALLRAAVAAREMKMYGESYDFVQKCIEINPRHMEAKVLLADLEYLIQDVQSTQPDMAKVARMKMEESIKLQQEEERGKKLGAKDMNMLCGVKAFQGYGDKREKLATSKDDRPPLSSLPYHHVGLPPEQVKVMDKFFQEQRDKKDYEKTKAKKEKDNYAKIKEEYKARAAEDVREGRMAGLEEIFGQKPALASSNFAEPAPKAPSLALASAKSKTEPSEKITLTAAEMAEIDNLFASLPTKTSQPIVPASSTSNKKKQLEQARAKMLA